jgi:hypothetical protein
MAIWKRAIPVNQMSRYFSGILLSYAAAVLGLIPINCILWR